MQTTVRPSAGEGAIAVPQTQAGAPESLKARIRAVRWEAEGINTYELEPLPGERFPPFTAGAHINVRLTPGLTRSYSLANDPSQRDRYEIGVQLAPESRGGSRHIHENWRPGQVVEISAPRNNFPLEEGATRTILIAGGIGITPMLSMIARLEALGRRWELHYVSRRRAIAGYLDRLEEHLPANVLFDEEPGGLRLDLAAVVAAAPPEAHLYCCGPAGMIQAFEALAAGRPPGTVHVEYFSADVEVAIGGDYVLELRRSGKTVAVQDGETMLDALLSAGANIGFACSEGVCGTCQVGVLEGVPDHRDQFLTEEEKRANRTVMVCCSGSRTPKLVLDI
ncbi:vanillate O-demethylase ferredoxin subunit [Roseomonas rosea]|uniref:Vanillate O-demethylase ferredoxin subunit n=1 Tax=Muricoccus roseus TaxID=198092 RepID=A0A1M6R4A9_9PROT|nr:vanillate O-demethylase ferredoxin subunit [Roseomonas rosea]